MKLTSAQKRFLKEIELEMTTAKDPDAWLDCYSEEWRTAQALADKGLIEIQGSKDHFFVRLALQSDEDWAKETLAQLIDRIGADKTQKLLQLLTQSVQNA